MENSKFEDSTRLLESNHEIQLRKVLKFMFPVAYLESRHFPVSNLSGISDTGLFCTLLKLKYAPKNINESSDPEFSFEGGISQKDKCTNNAKHGTRDYNPEVSTNPSTRSEIKNLRLDLNSSLQKHGAKLFGLCPIRRSIYDQCFDELIRQVTVNCIEQGLLLYRVRNETKLTMDYYRRAYESAVNYGIRKAVDVELRLNDFKNQASTMERSVNEATNRDECQNDLKGNGALDDRNKLETFDSMKQYYETKLAEKDKLIKHQQSMIEALTEKLVDDIRGPSI